MNYSVDGIEAKDESIWFLMTFISRIIFIITTSPIIGNQILLFINVKYLHPQHIKKEIYDGHFALGSRCKLAPIGHMKS